MRKKSKLNLLRGRLIAKECPKSAISEQYRTIRTSIEFSSLGEDLKTIICTSANAGEGKSTTISNIAVAFSQQGKRVLLVDADLRKPTAHQYFNRDNQMGLTNVLLKQKSLDEAILDTNVENLWLLPSGAIPPNPSEMLGSASMKSLVKEMSKSYDMVIFDAPPVLPVTDAQVLGNICDGAIFVVKQNYTDKDQLVKATDLLSKANVRILGTILNGVEKSNTDYYEYYGHSETPVQRKWRRQLN